MTKMALFVNIFMNRTTSIHLLKNGNDPYGFIALSIKDFNEVPSVKIEYFAIQL
jgi:hypothetical protein